MGRLAGKGQIGRRLVPVDHIRLIAVIRRGLGDGRLQRLRMVLGMPVPVGIPFRRRPMDDDGTGIRPNAHRTAELAFK